MSIERVTALLTVDSQEVEVSVYSDGSVHLAAEGSANIALSGSDIDFIQQLSWLTVSTDVEELVD